MTRKEVLNQYLNNEITPIATIGISNNCGIAILDILNEGMEEKVFGIYGNNEVFKRKLYFDKNDEAFFKLGSLTFYLNEAIRTYL
jgi:hypothetical protein